MSEENVELVRRAYEALNRGDLDAAVEIMAPDGEYFPSEAFPESRVRRGRDEMKGFLRWLTEEFDDAGLETHEFIDKGDKVVVAATIKGRGRQSGAETSWQVWHVWEIRGGLAVRCRAFMSREEALEAAGLPG